MSTLAELEGPGWRRLLAKARRRVETSGGVPAGSVSLPSPSEAERRTIIGITGRHRSPATGQLVVSLPDVDRWLHGAYGIGLIDVLETLGPPLRNRPAERASEEQARERMRDAARGSRHGRTDWCVEWLARIDRDGTLTRIARRGGVAEYARVLAVLDALPADGVALPVFAEQACGDTKALAGTPLATITLRAIAAWKGQPTEPGAAGQRQLWESVGVIVDDLTSQALVLNLPARGGPVGEWLTSAAASGLPFRLTLQQLTASPVSVEVPRLYVCENPAVLRTAAERLGPASAPLVCTEGVASVACQRVVAVARASGALVHWRNDFDWPGLRMTGSAIAEHGAVPWRMGAADYRAALRRRDAEPLTGQAVTSEWDPALATAMHEAGLAVMEERLIDTLLADLDGAGEGAAGAAW